MANDKHLGILMRGVEAWNRWKKEEQGERFRPRFETVSYLLADLTGADLAGMALSDADLSRVDLRCANLTHTQLVGANLVDSYLEGAIFRGANLSGADLSLSYCTAGTKMVVDGMGFGQHLEDPADADFTSANLSRARLEDSGLVNVSFKDADLTFASFTRALLDNADFHDARMMGTIFASNDLSTARGLEHIRHLGASSIDISTVYRSGGKLPRVFLQGLGVPDGFINFTQSEHAIETKYYSVFIACSDRDRSFAQKLFGDLQQRGVRCWYATDALRIGELYRKGIEKSIYSHDKLLLILSQNSIDSNWVEEEVETAFQKESDHNTLVLFPIRIDETVMQKRSGWPARIARTRHIGDFCEWRDDKKYRSALARLLRDLKGSHANSS